MSEWNGRRDVCPFCKGSGHRSHLAPLTKHQAAMYRFIQRHIATLGFAPTFEEIAERFDYSSLATVHEHLSNLERKGYITRSYNEVRGILCLVELDALGAVPTPEVA